jgi:hypothetical protein
MVYQNRRSNRLPWRDTVLPAQYVPPMLISDFSYLGLAGIPTNTPGHNGSVVYMETIIQ